MKKTYIVVASYWSPVQLTHLAIGFKTDGT